MIRTAIACLLLAVVGCESRDDPNETMATTQPKNTLRVEREGTLVDFPLSEASYNWVRRPHGIELTFACRAAEHPDQDHPPKVEVTIVLSEEPEIRAGVEWLNQPAYIDRDPLYNLTNYYGWTHEGFEDFSVRILGVEGSSVTCKLDGYISLNTDSDDPQPVSIVADFERDESMKRGVW